MTCTACGKEAAVDFKFCPNCGKPAEVETSVIELPRLSPEVLPVTDTPTGESKSISHGVSGRSNKTGTWIFGAFSAIALLVSILKGIVPIYLIESAIWAGAAWYWHAKKTHSELAKAIVIVLAALCAFGEVVEIVSHWNSTSTASTRIDPYEKYAVPSVINSPNAQDHGTVNVADGNQAAASGVAEIERQAIALLRQKRYSDARPLFEQACNGGEMRACNDLGYLYAQGLGGLHDPKKARDVYKKACDQGTLPSCASLGSLYQDAGDGDEARKYFEKACTGGVAEACDLLRGLQ
jgi:TPR repeat protein